MIRLSQHELVLAFTVSQGQGHTIRADYQAKLVKRKIAHWQNGKLHLTPEGRSAFERWSGTRL